MIKAIVFDYAGVIAEGALVKWFRKHFQDTPETKRIYTLITATGDSGEIGLEEFLDLVAAHTGAKRYNLYEKIYGEINFNNEVLELIKRLKHNYKTAILSNNQHFIIKPLLERYGHAHIFDEIIISSEFGLSKPNPAFFQKMLDLLQITKEEAIFIDDTQANVDAGNRLGIQSFLFTDIRKLKNDLQSRGITI